MHAPDFDELTRRQFLKRTGLAVGAVGTGLIFPANGAPAGRTVRVIRLADDTTVSSTPVQWAVAHLRETLVGRGVEVLLADRIEPSPDISVLVAHGQTQPARELCRAVKVALPDAPESLGLLSAKSDQQRVLLVCGNDARGLVYGVLELADQVQHAADPLEPFVPAQPIIEKPANVIRSAARAFVSNVQDKAWFYDREFWRRYLTTLATHRFNRFALMFGIGYDFTSHITDAYFHFAYPFLVSPKGYHVRAVPLPDAERKRNLETLQFITRETARRGLHFQLGLWTHAYHWTHSPHANYVIEGLTPEKHAVYCRDALADLLEACPDIEGVTFRVHGESGVPEGSYGFWKTVFDGIVRCGRRVGIDMHAKGMNERMIEVALGTGMPVTVSPKFWAEHIGLPYMQCAIRPLEMPPAHEHNHGFFALSSGSRRFLRYGYGDLLKENRRYGVMHRIWPGTQRVLLWGCPEFAQGYGRISSFCGSLGVELFEPLFFKGRKGSGLPGGRNAYAEEALKPQGGDFEKFLYTYRVWGRCLYNPDTDPDGWQRYLRRQFGRGAGAVEQTLAASTNILPLVTTAHCPSAANNNYWPEMYTNMSIVDASHPQPYWDTMSPKRFGMVSPLDPELFSRMEDFAEELLDGKPGAKYSPAWVAAMLLRFADKTDAGLRKARAIAARRQSAAFRRFAPDAAVQSGLGRFFAHKFRAGVLYAIYERTGDKSAASEALSDYRLARKMWAGLADAAKDVYLHDITYGPEFFQRGHWLDRLQAIDEDISRMEKLFAQTSGLQTSSAKVDPHHVRNAVRAVREVPPPPPVLTRFHTPPPSFQRGKALAIEASLDHTRNAPQVASVYLRYRRVNQAELWRAEEMISHGQVYRSAIPAAYTDSPFPLQYHFELHSEAGRAWLYPGLSFVGRHEPFFLVRQKR